MNKKVPFAILSCFSMAFIIQGVLKLCGVFIFEKALSWGLFKIIDDNIVLSIIYYSILIYMGMYCLTFAISRKPYSKKWYHYVILLIFAVGSTTLKFLTNSALTVESSLTIDILYDLVLYVIVPFIIHIILPKDERVFSRLSLQNIVLLITTQLLLYLFYLGLNYWSSLLNSVIPDLQYVGYASAMFLMQLEVYIGLGALMFTFNVFIQKFIKENKMLKPVNVATDEAKEQELKRRKELKAKKNGK